MEGTFFLGEGAGLILVIKDIVTKPQKKTQLILPTPSELWKPSLHPEISSAKPFNSRRI